MNTPLANLARQSAIKTDHGNAPPPLDFRDDTSSGDAFSMDCVSDSDSSDIQHIKQVAVKPTLDLKNVPIWDNTISTRDNAQAIKIALGSAGYLDTTKGKGTRQEQMILLAALRHALPHGISHRQQHQHGLHEVWIYSMEGSYTELQGSAMEERKRFEEEITAGQLPNELVRVYVRRYQNLWNLLNKAHGQWTFERHANGMRILDDTTPTGIMNDPRYDRHQRESAERRVNACYGYNPRDNYDHQAPPGQHFYNNNRTNQNRLQR
eukprot:jgi/Tetstr1/443813/TSEL_003267.t2